MKDLIKEIETVLNNPDKSCYSYGHYQILLKKVLDKLKQNGDD